MSTHVSVEFLPTCKVCGESYQVMCSRCKKPLCLAHSHRLVVAVMALDASSNLSSNTEIHKVICSACVEKATATVWKAVNAL